MPDQTNESAELLLDSGRALLDDARRQLEQIRAEFEIGGAVELPTLAARLAMIAELLAGDALRRAGGASRPLVQMLIDSTRRLIDAIQRNPSRVDLRVAILSTDLLLSAASYPWSRISSGGEYCPGCASPHLFRSKVDVVCLDCGWCEVAGTDPETR